MPSTRRSRARRESGSSSENARAAKHEARIGDGDALPPRPADRGRSQRACRARRGRRASRANVRHGRTCRRRRCRRRAARVPRAIRREEREHDAPSVASTHRARQRLKPSSSGGRAPGNAIVCAICACHCARPTTRASAPARRARRACRGRHSGASAAARGCARRRRARRRRRGRRSAVAVCGSCSLNDENDINCAWIGSQVASGIDEQASAMIGSDDQLAVAAGSEAIAVACRDGETAFRVEHELRDAAEDL